MSEPIPRNFLTKPEAYIPPPTVREQHLAMPKCTVCGARFSAAFSADHGRTWFCGPCRPEVRS